MIKMCLQVDINLLNSFKMHPHKDSPKGHFVHTLFTDVYMLNIAF